MATYDGSTFGGPEDALFNDGLSGTYTFSPTSVAQTYRMRGVVSGNQVYWSAPIIDTTGVYYNSGVTTPTSIVCVGLVV